MATKNKKTGSSTRTLTDREKKLRAKRKKAKLKKLRRRRIFGTVFALLILIGVCVGGYFLFKHYADMIHRGDESVAILDSVPMEEESEAESKAESKEESKTESKAESGIDESKAESKEEPKQESKQESKPEESKQEESSSEESSAEDSSDPLSLVNWHDYSEEVYREEGVQNILLIGIDTRGTATYMNTDVMMVVSINENTDEISLTSLMRDCFVFIPDIRGNGAYGRLNAAAAWGGVPLLIRTIEMNFNICIDHYAKVNFNSFVDAINVLGGVSVTMTEEEVKAVNKTLSSEYTGNLSISYDPAAKISSGAGIKSLNGTQALAYARLRKIDSDFQRTERQRKIMTAAIKKALKCSLDELNSMLEAVLPYMELDADFDDMTIFKFVAKAITQYKDYKIQSFRLPVYQAYTNLTLKESTGVTAAKAQVLSLDFEKNIDYFFEKVYHK